MIIAFQPGTGGNRGRQSRRSEQALTITELMITMTILMMVMAAIISSHLFGLRFFEITKAKLVASDDARRCLSRMVSEIRGAKDILIGDGSLSSFTRAADGTVQQGGALQIYPTTNTNYYIRYYYSGDDGKLRRTTNGSTYTNLMASSVTNSVIFTSEDFAGNVITNDQNNRVIGITLRFRTLEFPVINIGASNYYNNYQLRTRITRRALE